MHHYGGLDKYALLGESKDKSILNLLQQPQPKGVILTESYSIIM